MAKREHASTPGQTRKSDDMRKRSRKQERPLPLDLQILPPIKRRLPLHPHCATSKADTRAFLSLQHYPAEHFVAGRDLVLTRERWGIIISGKLRGHTADWAWAVGYCMAARSRGLSTEIIDTGRPLSSLVYTK